MLGTREEFCKIANMPFGKERRKLLLEWCTIDDEFRICKYGFTVNRKHCLIVNKDPDLKYLIKKCKLKQINSYGYNCLVLTDKYNNTGNLKGDNNVES